MGKTSFTGLHISVHHKSIYANSSNELFLFFFFKCSSFKKFETFFAPIFKQSTHGDVIVGAVGGALHVKVLEGQHHPLGLLHGDQPLTVRDVGVVLGEVLRHQRACWGAEVSATS